jgi:plasmid stabilization system protein ParE
VAHIVITAAADEDTAFIIDDLAGKAGGRVALRYDADFDAAYRRLEQFPKSGAPRRQLGATVRMVVVPPYAIFYRYVETDDTVLVQRILHTSRNITRRMLREPPSQP